MAGFFDANDRITICDVGISRLRFGMYVVKDWRSLVIARRDWWSDVCEGSRPIPKMVSAPEGYPTVVIFDEFTVGGEPRVRCTALSETLLEKAKQECSYHSP